MVFCILAIVMGLAVLVADQLTKLYIISNFSLGEGCGFIKGLIDIVYIHNRGAAWGMLSGKTWFLVALTSVVMIVCIFLLIKTFKDNKLMLWAITLVLSGGVGNLIDRVFFGGNVIDFLHFEFWPTFPIFNVADCAIVLGAGLMMLGFLMDMVKDTKNKKETDTNGDI
jgi:signal peptidase II